MKAPPENMIEPETDRPTGSKGVSISAESSVGSEESEECEVMKERLIDLNRHEYSTGSKMRMKMR